MNDSTAVFIDGGYLKKLLYHDFNTMRVDYGKLVKEIAHPNTLFRAYYYDCLPYQSNPPTPEESSRYGKARRFVDALRHINRFEIRLGKLAFRGIGQDGKPIFQQKRVDLMLGVDMALLSSKGKISSLALISGDSDCIPAVEAVKKESIIVQLWHGVSSNTTPSQELMQCCDDNFEITKQLLKKAKL